MARSSDPTKVAAWRGRFRRFARSGLAVARFCAKERVSVASFYYWRKKLGPQALRRHTSDRVRPGAFQPVRVVPLDTTRTHSRSVAAKPCVASRVPAASGVWIQLPGGTQIEVRAEHPDAVRAVIAEVARFDRGVHVARVDGGPEAK